MAVGIEVLLTLHLLHTVGAVVSALFTGNWFYLLYEVIILSVIALILISLFRSNHKRCKCEKSSSPPRVNHYTSHKPRVTVQLSQSGNKARVQPSEMKAQKTLNGRPPGILRKHIIQIERIDEGNEEESNRGGVRSANSPPLSIQQHVWAEEPVQQRHELLTSSSPPKMHILNLSNSPPTSGIASPVLSEGAIDAAFNSVQEQVRLLYEELDSLYSTKYSSPSLSIPKFPTSLIDAQPNYTVTDL